MTQNQLKAALTKRIKDGIPTDSMTLAMIVRCYIVDIQTIIKCGGGIEAVRNILKEQGREVSLKTLKTTIQRARNNLSEDQKKLIDENIQKRYTEYSASSFDKLSDTPKVRVDVSEKNVENAIADDDEKPTTVRGGYFSQLRREKQEQEGNQKKEKRIEPEIPPLYAPHEPDPEPTDPRLIEAKRLCQKDGSIIINLSTGENIVLAGDAKYRLCKNRFKSFEDLLEYIKKYNNKRKGLL